MNMNGSHLGMKTAVLFAFLSIFFFGFTFGQSNGDYRSAVATGNWNTSASWEVYSGSWGAASDYPGQNAGAGTVTIRDGHSITLNVSPANAIGALTVGEGTSGALETDNTNRTLTITNNLTITANGSYNIERTILTVNGETYVSGSLTDNNNNGSAVFADSVVVNSGGSFSTANNSAFTFRGSITNNGTFSKTGTGAVTFNTNNQVIDGSNIITMAGTITVTGVTVTNKSTDLNLTSTGANSLTGTGGWTQGNNAILKFSGASMDITTTDFSTNQNTLNYTRGGAQTVLSTTYDRLLISTSGIKTLGGAITVNDSLDISGTATLASDIYQITGNASGKLIMASGTSLTLGNTLSLTDVLFPTNFTTANISLNSASTVTYQNLLDQTISSTPVYGNLTIATGGTKTINGDLTINGALTVTTATLSFGSSAARNVSVAGNLSGTGGIDMSGGSQLHTLILSGASNAITTFTTAAVASSVTFNGTVAQQVFASANYRNIIISGNSVKTLQGAVTAGGTLTINNTATLDPAAQNLTVSGSTTIAGTLADGNIGGTTSLQAVDLSGGTINGAATGVMTINGNLTMPTGNATIGRMALTVIGTTTIPTGRSLTINSNTGAKRFDGLITVEGTGTWTSTTETTTADLDLRGGIDVQSASGSFAAGGATFSSNDQSVSGAGAVSFGNAVSISGAITITNTNSAGVTFSNTVDGTVAGSTWKNGSNGVTYYQPGAITQPMNTGTLDVSTNPNTFHYSRGGAQSVKAAATSYYHLTISGSGAKTLQANTTVDGSLNIAAGSLDPAALDLTVSGNTTIAGTLADGNATGTTSLQDVDLSGGTINGAASGIVNINGKLTMPTGNGTIGRMILTVSDTTTVATGRSLTINNTNGAKRFDAIVRIQGTGTWTSTTETNAADLEFRGGIDVASSSGSFSGGGATFSTANQTVSGAGAVSFANAVSVSGAITVTNSNTNGVTFNSTVDGTVGGSAWKNDVSGVTYYQPGAATQPMNTGALDVSAMGNYFYYSRAGAQNIKAPLTTYYHLYITGGGTSTKTMLSDISCGGNLYVASSTTLSVSTFSLTVTGSTTLDGSITDASNSGTNTFTGLLTISSTGSLSSTANSPYVFGGGIINNGTFSKTGTGIVSFTSNQDIDGTAAMTLGGAITIDAGRTVTYKNTNSTGITIQGVLDGANSSSTWKNEVNSTVRYQPGVSTQPMNTGVLDVSATGNTFVYSDAGAQTIKAPLTVYYNLSCSGAGTKSLSAATTVNGNLSLSSTTLDVVAGQDYGLTVKGNWVNTSSTFNSQQGTVTFNGNSNQQITSNVNSFYNMILDIDSPGTQLSLNDDVTISNLLTLTDGVITTGASYRVIISNSASTSIGGYGPASFVNGNLRRNIASNTDTYVFPIGNGTATTNYYRADVDNNNLTGITYIDSRFKPLSGHLDSEMDVWDNFEHGSLVYSSVHTAGIWELEPDAAPSGGMYDAKFYIANMSGFTDNNFGPLKRPVGSTSGADWTNGGGQLNHNDSDGRTVASGFMERRLLTSFSEFGGGSGSSSGAGLPVELIIFKAITIDNNAVRLEWKTATETNNDFFTVERSKDGEMFSELGVFEAAGNSAVENEYFTIDRKPLNGIGYYRLKQTDFDGQYSYSDVIAVNIELENGDFVLSPNPFSGNTLTVSTSSEMCTLKCTFHLFDVSGKEIKMNVVELALGQVASIQLPEFVKPGLYFIALRDGEKVLRKKLLVN